MSVTIARFLGDERGFVLRPEDVPDVGVIPVGWVLAEIGVTGTFALIDLAKAYSIEPSDWFDRRKVAA